MASATRPSATTRKTPAGPAGRCSLTLTINGAAYAVRPIRPEAFGVVKAFSLRKAGGERHAIAETIEGPTCDCGDYAWRRDGTGEPCKHLAAARACGLL